MTLYLATRFYTADLRRYVYSYDGPLDVRERDFVEVSTKRGLARVEVMDVSDLKPDIDLEIKPIIRVLESKSLNDAAHGASAHSPPGCDTSDSSNPSGGETIDERTP